MSDDELPTFVVDGDGDFSAAAATMRVPDDHTYRVTEDDALDRGLDLDGQRLPLGVLAPGTLLCGDCTVVRTLHAHETQRPGLYLCTAAEGDVVVKVYASQHPPRADLWQRLPALRHPNVLRVYRVVELNGFYYEIQEYCNGGTLEEIVPRPGTSRLPVDPELVDTEMVPQLCAGLEYMHIQEIIHRDIKPSNIYLKRDGDRDTLVLGDFDIAAMLASSRTSRDTQRAAGTWLYTAPEAFPRFTDDTASTRRGRVTRSADYYSLGITLIELLVGTTSLHACQLPDLFDFYLQGGRVEVPASLPGHLTLLLRGLLIRNRATRWGAEEVRRWRYNENSPADIKHIHDDEKYQFTPTGRPYRLGAEVALDLASLADAITREPEKAAEDLLSGDILLNWIGTLDSNIAREVRHDREAYRHLPALALFCAMQRCDPTRPFTLAEGIDALDAQEWIARAIHLVMQRRQAPEAFCTQLLVQQFAAWLRRKSDPEPKLADAVETIVNTPPRARLEELAYLLQPTRPYPLLPGVAARTPGELVALTYGPADDWRRGVPACYQSSFQRWQDGCLAAWLRRRGLPELAAQSDATTQRLAGDPYAAFETVLRLLEPKLPPVEIGIDASELRYTVSVGYKKVRTVTLPYGTRTPGMPFGALTADQTLPGLTVNQPVVRRREGALEVTVDSYADLPAMKTFVTLLALNSGYTRLAHPPVVFKFRVLFPWQTTATRVLAGAGVGALVLMLPRLLLHFCLPAGGKVVVLDPQLVSNIWHNGPIDRAPLIAEMLLLLLLLVAIYGGLRVWMVAFGKSEV